jgi:hypothetical protein
MDSRWTVEDVLIFSGSVLCQYWCYCLLCTVKKVSDFSAPSRDVTIENIANLFVQCVYTSIK